MSPLHDAPLPPRLVATALSLHDDRPCLDLGGRTLTYREVREATSRMAQAQRALGLDVGSRVAVLSGNRPEVLTNLAATIVNGCVLTPLHPMGSLDDHAFVVDDAGIECLIVDVHRFGERARALAERCPGLRVVGFGPSDVGDDYLALADGFEARPLEPAEVTPDDLCTLLYTGGTTGRPKGVLLPQRVWATLTSIQLADWELPAELRVLVATPLSHAAMSLLMPVLIRGGSFHVLESFSPDAFYDRVERDRITATLIVPVMLYALQSSERYGTADVSSLESIYYGASPMSPTKLADAIERWGRIFFQFYGQTEAPMAVTALRREDHDPADPTGAIASCGRPSPWVRVALLDPDGIEVEQGEPGEICVRGPLVMDGYAGRPDETAETLVDGWLRTGDVGRLDERGFVHIVDRTKDMIISGGFNVYPREVEDVLTTHGAVEVAMVVGVPDETWGEAVIAVVRLRPDAEASDELAAELRSLVREAKGPAQSPKRIEFVDEVPLTPVGKPDKRAVRARFWEGADRAVG